MNPFFLADFYKLSHKNQYPKGITRIWTNWTPRYSRVKERQGAVHFGLQYFIKEYLIDYFDREFFGKPLGIILADYREMEQKALGNSNPDVSHIEELYHLGYLPLEIYSAPEGCFVPSGVPACVIVNTDPRFFWLPNFIETLLSSVVWGGSTSATTATVYHEIFTKAAKEFGETDLSFVRWQGHDFSMRGMSGIEAAQLSGMGHLLSFNGTDSIPAIVAMSKYYGADYSCGGSVAATEHSVMCAGSQEGEFKTFKRLITEVYPSGIISIVSDTWDLWRVLTDYIPRLKDLILARDGKIVIRPDSGDPVKILVGNPDSSHGPERAGVLRLLADAMGTDNQGHINKMGAIYGDSITPERARAICSGAISHKLSPFNCVFGIGSWTYQMVTRDTYGFAMKATAVEKDGQITPIFKDPVTDNGQKKSHFGIPMARWTHAGDGIKLTVDQNVTHAMLSGPFSAFCKVFKDGELLIDWTLDDIKQTMKDNVYEN